jgi:hypothetical protein
MEEKPASSRGRQMGNQRQYGKNSHKRNTQGMGKITSKQTTENLSILEGMREFNLNISFLMGERDPLSLSLSLSLYTYINIHVN